MESTSASSGPQQAATARPAGAGASRPPAGGRPRDPDREAAILAAAIDLVAEEGLPGLTMDAVAARAGASKATLYRRWPDRLGLAVALLDALRAQRGPVPDTGTARGDLAALLQDRDTELRGATGALLLGLAAERGAPPDLTDALHRAHEAERQRVNTVLQRGAERGEIPDGFDHELLVGLVTAIGLERAVTPAAVLDVRGAAELAGRLLHAAGDATSGGHGST